MNSNNSKPSLSAPEIELRAVRAEKLRRSLYEFVLQAWPIVEPATPFVNGIQVEAICQHLQAVSEGKIGNLIINVPPGHAKSLLGAVLWPVWHWITSPATRWLFASYSASLSVRDSLRCRHLIESEWYQELWGHIYHLSPDQNEKHRFENNRTGCRIATSVGGTATGERADIVVVDDPHSVDQAESDNVRHAAVEWSNGTMSTRINDFTTGHKVVIQQRLHEADLTGDLLARGGYEWLCLPAEFEPERRCTTSIGWSDPRQESGELLWPDKITAAHLQSLQVCLGTYRYAGQYQQRPAPATGGIFQRSWWQYWRPAHMDLPPVSVHLPDGQMANIEAVPLPEDFDCQIQSWDLAFKNTATSDFVAGQVWAAKGADRFLLDQNRARMDMPQTKEAIRAMSEKWPLVGAKLVEDKANGPAVIQELQREIAGLIDEHVLWDPEPTQNACAIRKRGAWIPGLVHTPSIKGSDEKYCVTRLYSNEKLQVCSAEIGAEAGVYYLRQLLAAQKLKVFGSLSGFLSQYRTGDENALLLQCCFVLLASSGSCMRPKPVPQPVYRPRLPTSERSWMGYGG